MTVERVGVSFDPSLLENFDALIRRRAIRIARRPSATSSVNP